MTEWIVARTGDSVSLTYGDMVWGLAPVEARRLGVKLLNLAWEVDEGDGSRVRLAKPGVIRSMVREWGAFEQLAGTLRLLEKDTE